MTQSVQKSRPGPLLTSGLMLGGRPPEYSAVSFRSNATASEAHDRSVGVPPDFGAPGGSPIRNISTILPDLWRSLGHDRPPAVAFILVEPLSMWRVSGDSASGSNPFGHSAVAYTLGGKTQVMNIVGAAGRELVNFMPMEQYLFGTNNFDTGPEQGGAYNRPMELVGIWDWPEEKIQAMHDQFVKIREMNRRGEADFFLAFPGVRNFARNLLPGHWSQLGNCARYTSSGLVAAGLLPGTTEWPKRIAVDLLKRHKKTDPDNVSVVRVDRIPHAHLSFGRGLNIDAWVSPFAVIDNLRFRRLRDRADARIVVPDHTTTAVVEVLTKA